MTTAKHKWTNTAGFHVDKQLRTGEVTEIGSQPEVPGTGEWREWRRKQVVVA